MAEDEELSSRTSPWNAAAFAAALEPRGGDNYTRRRVSKEITESKELRKDGALVGVPNKWGFKPNGLLYDDEAAKVCFDVVDPRVVRSKKELQAQERLAAAAERGADVPHKYAKHVIDVSRRGVDGFDFSRYNRTPFGGLENALGDARFTNAALLLLYFLPELRQLVLADQYEPTAKNVLPSAPPAANFVLELSFLFQVLDLAPRQPAHKRACHSANALSALTLVPDAVALGLVQKAGAAAEAPAGERKRRPLARKALVFHRFALEQLAAHLADGARVQRLLGFTSATENAFLDDVGEGRTRTTCALTTDLLLDRPFHHAPTPALARGGDGRVAADDDVQEPWRFCDALRASLVRSARGRESTKRYEPIAQRRTPRPDLPELLAFHCVADADDATTDGAWASDGGPWVAAAFDLEVDGAGRCRVFEGAAGCGDAELDAATVDAATYELVGVLSHVDRGGDAQTDADATVGEMEALEGVAAHARAAASYFTRAAEEQAKPASFAAKLAIERDRQSSPSRRDRPKSTETVVDYNTRFSGVAAEDLDPATSKHDLYRRAVVCMKLRRLVDAGCVLVGHSLQSDFRVMNVAVPPDQVIDTAQLFSRPGERKISLRFLCSYLLDHVIQDDNHDSVENARAALRLYRLYQKLKAEGTLRETLGRVYDHGRKTEWTIVAPKAELRSDAAAFGADGDAADAPPDVAGLTVSAPPDEPQPPGTAAPPS
ncbi:poly(A)-specific ribonuclease [Aureococcus anophagefferens]|nr:poly(A)-specific ribonuclease [Aureococcus anophagefferens]